MTRKIAEPMIAAARCTTGSYATPPRIGSERLEKAHLLQRFGQSNRFGIVQRDRRTPA
jgi:hypothetical protein